jgi:hypothetical protein
MGVKPPFCLIFFHAQLFLEKKIKNICQMSLRIKKRSYLCRVNRKDVCFRFRSSIG